MKTTIKIDRRYRLDKVTPKNPRRNVSMSYVLVKGFHAYATNGRTLARIPVQREGDLEDMTVGREAWGKLVRTKTTHESAQLSTDGEDDVVFGDGASQRWQHEDMRGDWPSANPEAVMPTDEQLKGGVRLGINAKLLLELAEAIGSSDGVVWLTIPKAEDGEAVQGAVRVKLSAVTTAHDSEPFGVIVPVTV